MGVKTAVWVDSLRSAATTDNWVVHNNWAIPAAPVAELVGIPWEPIEACWHAEVTVVIAEIWIVIWVVTLRVG